MDEIELYGKTLEEIYLIYKDKKIRFDYFSYAGLSVGALMSMAGLFEVALVAILLGKVTSYSKKRKMLYNYHLYYRNSKEFTEAFQSYQIVLDELSKMANDLQWDNEMKLFSGYSYLLKQGYLSLEHEFRYSAYCDSCKYLWGNNVMMGVGNCKHISSMFNDLLRTNGYFAYNLSILLSDEALSYGLNDMELLELEGEEDLYEIPGEVLKDKKDIISKLLSSMIAKRGEFTNHLVTWFVDKEHSYAIDPTNDEIFLVGDDLNFYTMNGCKIGDGFIRSLFNGEENFDLKDIIKPSSKELLESRLGDYKIVWNSCFELKDVFEKFYLEHRELYEEVVAKRKVLVREYTKYSI